MDEFLAEISLRDKESFNKYSKNIICNVEKIFEKNKNNISGIRYKTLYKKELLSLMTSEFINDICFKKVKPDKKSITGTNNDKELSFNEYGDLVKLLKRVVYDCATYGDDIYLYEKKGEKVITFLVDFYRKNNKALPVDYREEFYKGGTNIHIDLKERLICDYIAGMMDTFAISRYEMFSGKKFDQILI